MVFKEVLTVIHCTHWTLAPPAPLPPSRPTPRSKRGTSLSLGHYSIMLGWVDGGKVQSGGESRAAREAFFAGGLRLRPFKRPSSSLYVSLSCLSASPAPPSLAISARSFVRPQPWRRHPLPSSSSSPRSRARIHMYLAPDTMDSEMAPLVDRPTETPPLDVDRKTEDDSGNGRRSERRRRRGTERERASGRKKRGALLPGTHAEIARESLLGHESPGCIVCKVVPPPPYRQRERPLSERT